MDEILWEIYTLFSASFDWLVRRSVSYWQAKIALVDALNTLENFWGFMLRLIDPEDLFPYLMDSNKQQLNKDDFIEMFEY